MSELRQTVRNNVAARAGCQTPCRMSVLDCACLNTTDAAIALIRNETLEEAAARIAQLEAALRDLIWYTNQLELTVYDPSDWPTEHDEVRNARAALEEACTSS